MGAVRRMETGIEGTIETDAVGTAETCAKGTAGMGAMGVAGGAAVGIPTSAAIPSPSKVSTNREICIQIKGDRSKGVTQIHIYEEEITKEGED